MRFALLFLLLGCEAGRPGYLERCALPDASLDEQRECAPGLMCHAAFCTKRCQAYAECEHPTKDTYCAFQIDAVTGDLEGFCRTQPVGTWSE